MNRLLHFPLLQRADPTTVGKLFDWDGTVGCLAVMWWELQQMLLRLALAADSVRLANDAAFREGLCTEALTFADKVIRHPTSPNAHLPISWNS